jgi:hypothetical protein
MSRATRLARASPEMGDDRRSGRRRVEGLLDVEEVG